MTNNPDKVAAVRAAGVVVEAVALLVAAWTDDNRAYLDANSIGGCGPRAKLTPPNAGRRRSGVILRVVRKT